MKTIVVMRFLGYSNDEIAAELGCVTRTVERKLNLIRRIWGSIAGSTDSDSGSEVDLCKDNLKNLPGHANSRHGSDS